MNDQLKSYAKTEILYGLTLCTAEEINLFKRMYSHKDLELPIEQIVNKMSEEHLETAMSQVQRTIAKKIKNGNCLEPKNLPLIINQITQLRNHLSKKNTISDEAAILLLLEITDYINILDNAIDISNNRYIISFSQTIVEPCFKCGSVEGIDCGSDKCRSKLKEYSIKESTEKFNENRGNQEI